MVCIGRPGRAPHSRRRAPGPDRWGAGTETNDGLWLLTSSARCHLSFTLAHEKLGIPDFLGRQPVKPQPHVPSPHSTCSRSGLNACDKCVPTYQDSPGAGPQKPVLLAGGGGPHRSRPSCSLPRPAAHRFLTQAPRPPSVPFTRAVVRPHGRVLCLAAVISPRNVTPMRTQIAAHPSCRPELAPTTATTVVLMGDNCPEPAPVTLWRKFFPRTFWNGRVHHPSLNPPSPRGPLEHALVPAPTHRP
ncbi:uncharacterized protein LOC105721024 [Aotus nancymaae]|uniref:uncharacterized protein LOC105721024 n=1 Tax=Aotus nancymaae TaxID=37293 RepID=UPI0030FF2D4B